LEGGRGVSKSEEHNCGFKQSFAGFEGGFVFVAFFNVNIIVFLSNVELREEALSCKIMDEF